MVCWVLSLLSQVGGCRIPHRNSSRLGSSALGASSGPCPTRHGSQRSEDVIQEVKGVWQEATLSRGGGGGMDLQPISRYHFSPFSFSRFSLLPLSCRCRSPYITPPQFLLPYPPLLLPNPRSLSSSSHLLLSSALRRYKEGREASPPPPALLIPPPLSLSLSLRNWRNYI